MPRKKVQQPAPAPAPNRKRVAKRRDAFNSIADAFTGFRPARDVLTVVRSVPTIFVGFDHAVGVGGWPTERVSVIHGPSNEGKTLFLLGLMCSFLMREHFVYFVDAERTTPIDWVQNVMGVYAHSDRFLAEHPASYEETVDKVRKFCRTVAQLRKDGKIDPDTTALVVVDSIRKLTPEDLVAKISKLGASGDKGSIDGMGGRAAQMRAALNSAWMDELVPLLDETKCAFVTIARETEDPNADFWARQYGNDYKVGGGRAIIYDSSLVIRVQRAGWIQHGDGAEKKVYGERHRITIRKTKVAGKEGRQIVTHFHSSNGVLVPTGFDKARDLLELGERFGIVKVNGGRYTFHTMKGMFVHAAVTQLHDDIELLAALESAVRDQFSNVEPEEIEGAEPE